MKNNTTLKFISSKVFSFYLFLFTLFFTTIQSARSQALVANWEVINMISGPIQNQPNIIAMTYGNNTYAAVGYLSGQKVLLTSTNGENWTTSTFALPLPTAFPDDIVFMDGKFKLVTNGTVYTSTNLETWQFESVHSVFSARNLKKVNNLYFQGGEGRFAISTNGLNWTTPMNSGDYLDLAYGNNLYVLVGRQAAKGILFTSTDGITWNNIIEVADNYDMFYSVDFYNGTFILAGNNGLIGKSTNGTDWTFSTPMGVPNSFFSIRHILDHWVVSAFNKVYYSSDGNTWTESVITGGNISNLKRVEVYNNTGFIPGNFGKIIKTDDTILNTLSPENLAQFTLYPNPATSYLTINLLQNTLAENTKLALFNPIGQLVKQVFITAPQTYVDVATLPNGLYTYQISNFDNVVKTGKIIKQ